jgi:signal recognition particle subunit SRP54
MGPLQKVMSMIPGFSNMQDKIDYEESQKRLSKFKVIMDSMTKEEKDEPNLIKGKRIERIAKGAGVGTHDVKGLLKQYNQSKKTMSSFGKDRKMRKQLMKQMGNMNLDDLQDLQ